MYSWEEISARLEIRDVLYRYCRGIDRRDKGLLRSAYWPDAVDRRGYGPPDASPGEFADRVIDGFGELPAYSQHHVTNVFIDLDLAEGVARVESYNLVMHPVGPETSLVLATEDGGAHLRVMGGRALDRFECRDGEWRIARRVMLVDWSRDDLPGGSLFAGTRHGLDTGGAGTDPSYTVLPTL
ncbi:nuclear transport factor 2 family protein [Actinomadura darangshiensis]|uniref:nuclear transport factor 2 family protein n=1 Tax=Actinomadura darangshiensis TaxID=705336 RepID=UPI00140CB533|nr:nuclear transport factor 2 family protein [Actinomadura darangshiensis]